MSDLEKRKYSLRLTQRDLPRLQALVDADPIGTCASLARLLNRDHGALYRWAEANGLKFKAERKRIEVKAPGLVGQLLQECDRRGITGQRLAKELHVSNPQITFWRSGRSSPPFYAIEGICTLLGYELRLEVKR